MSKTAGQHNKTFLLWADIISVALAYIITLHFRFTLFDAISKYAYPYVWINILLAEVVYITVFSAYSIYKNIIKYVSLRFFVFLGILCGVSGTIMVIISVVVGEPYVMNWKSNILAAMFIAAMVVCSRGIIRLSSGGVGKPRNNSGYKNILIIGAGSAAQWLINSIQISKKARYNIVGMLDDNPDKIGKIIHGVTVLGSSADLKEICSKKNVEFIIVAIPSLSAEAKHRIYTSCADTGVPVKTLPNVADIVENQFPEGDAMQHVRDVSVEDLLERKPIQLNNEQLHDEINGKVVLVTGGGGSIGSELCRQIAKHGPEKLVVLDIYENNAYDLQMELNSTYPELDLRVVIASVRDYDRICAVFEEYHPDSVFHAAAHKHVPLMEYNPGESIKNNVFGTYNVARAADKYGTRRFVLISTDKAVNPTNIMGASKRICEMIVQSMQEISKTEFVAVRFGNVLGSNGSVIPLFKRQIENREPITVTHKDITRFFMTIPEAAQLVLQAACYAKGGEIFVLDMGQPVKIYDLAVNLIKLSGLKPFEDIEIKITGLRPGEKLYEELLMDEEGLKNTENSKIFIGQPIFTNMETLKKSLDKLEKAMVSDDNEYIKDVVAEVVPTYVRHPEQQHKEEKEDIVTA